MEICIKIWRRSVTIREILQKEPKISSTLTFQLFGEKKNRKIWKIEKLRVKNVENLGKKLSDKNDN